MSSRAIGDLRQVHRAALYSYGHFVSVRFADPQDTYTIDTGDWYGQTAQFTKPVVCVKLWVDQLENGGVWIPLHLLFGKSEGSLLTVAAKVFRRVNAARDDIENYSGELTILLQQQEKAKQGSAPPTQPAAGQGPKNFQETMCEYTATLGGVFSPRSPEPSEVAQAEMILQAHRSYAQSFGMQPVDISKFTYYVPDKYGVLLCGR